MGQKALEPTDITVEELPMYLRTNHSVYMDLGDTTYYLTDVNDHYWRVQSTTELNEKGHYVDLTEPVDSVEEFLNTPTIDGKTIAELHSDAVFYASFKPEA